MGEDIVAESIDENAKIVNFNISITYALEAYARFFTDSRKEESLQQCDLCLQFNEETQLWGEVICCDGVSQPIHCCAVGDTEENECPNPVKNSRKRFCEEHEARENDCGVDFCNQHVVPPSKACPNHQNIYDNYLRPESR